ncbi:MAG: hypothetical protein AAF720_02525 [Pseudomonadota bacterium]
MQCSIAQLSTDPAKRLEAEAVLLDGLSEEAVAILSADENVQHVFEEGYFDQSQPAAVIGGNQATMSGAVLSSDGP